MATARYLLAALFLFNAVAIAQSAKVTYRDSKGRERTDDANISSYTYAGLEMKMRRGGAVRTVSTDDVLNVVYSRAPEAYTEAMGLYSDGDIRGALGAFEDVIADERTARSRPWARENALFYMWDGLRKIGAFDDATAAAETLMKDYAKSRFIPQIKLQNAWDVYGQGDAGKARGEFTALAAEAAKRGYAPSFAAHAKLGVVRAQLVAGDVAAAGSALESAKPSLRGDSLRALASAVEGHILVAKKDYDRALAQFRQLLDRLDYKADPVAFALAANGLGECAYAKSDFKRAALQFSQTFALCKDLPGTDEEVGWAFWRFANAARQHAGSLEDENERRTWLARHRTNRRRAAELFSRTRGGNLALREIGN